MDPIVIAVALVVAALVVMVVARRRPGSETGTVGDAPTRADAAAREDAAARDRAVADDDGAYDEAPAPIAEPEHDEPAFAGARDDQPAVADEAFAIDEQDHGEDDGEADDEVDEPPTVAPEAAPKAAATDAPGGPLIGVAGEAARSSRDTCPKCGSPMIERVAKRGPREGRSFLACSRYPTCRTAFEIEGSGASRA